MHVDEVVSFSAFDHGGSLRWAPLRRYAPPALAYRGSCIGRAGVPTPRELRTTAGAIAGLDLAIRARRQLGTSVRAYRRTDGRVPGRACAGDGSELPGQR